MLVYIVDDDVTELMLWSVTTYRFHKDVTCELFRDCDQFKAAVLLNPPDAVVIDLIMPFNPGMDVCNWVHEHSDNTKVFFNTGLEGDEYKVLADVCKATYLCKTTKLRDRLEVVANGCRS